MDTDNNAVKNGAGVGARRKGAKGVKMGNICNSVNNSLKNGLGMLFSLLEAHLGLA